jgi:hypothetical protein
VKVGIKLIAGAVTSVAMILGVASPVFAAGPDVVGTWSVVDHGQGCWGGGNLLADGSGNGGGGCAFMTPAGEEVASLKPASWAFTDATKTAVNLCASFVGKKGPVFPVGVAVTNCIVVPVGGSAPVEVAPETYGKVNIF